LLSLEFVIFGLPTLLFVWMQHCRTCGCNSELLEQMASAYPAETAVPWIILINIYAGFVPNSLRRAVVVIGAMGVIPLAGAVLVSIEQPVVRDRMFGGGGGFSALLLWLVISGVTAIYGSFRIGRLRREAYDAKQLGAYSLKKKLGAGGMGEVHLAEHQLLKRPCAIKLIRTEKAADATAIARFETEVQATARLTHVNTVEIYDFGYTQDGTFYYAMEFLPGLELQALVDKTGPMPAARVVHLLKQVSSALGEAHRAGLIHRHIKPGNIFATERGGVFDVAKLLDFGLVKSLGTPESSPEITIEGAVIGSPMYAPPERILGESEPDARGDSYSLGAAAYFLLTGRPVFRGDKILKVLFAHANESPQPLSELRPDIPVDVEAIIMQCLAKNPDERFQTAEELEAALSATACSTAWTQQRAHECWDAVASSDKADTKPSAAEIETQVLA
jgi:serine/threonine-protein kinase